MRGERTYAPPGLGERAERLPGRERVCGVGTIGRGPEWGRGRRIEIVSAPHPSRSPGALSPPGAALGRPTPAVAVGGGRGRRHRFRARNPFEHDLPVHELTAHAI